MEIQMGHGLIVDEMVKQVIPMISEDKHEEFKKDMNMVMNKMMDNIADIYMEVSTKEEVDALLEFYTSPIGQQIQDKLPEIMERSMKMQMELQQDLMPIMQKYIK